MALSVVVAVDTSAACAGERASMLERCLAALHRQSLPSTLYEVVVVDADPFGPASLAVSLAIDRSRRASGPGRNRQPRIVYMPCARGRGEVAAVDVGVRIATASTIAIVDAACEAGSDWLRDGLMSVAAGWDAVHPNGAHPRAGRSRSPFFARRRVFDAIGSAAILAALHAGTSSTSTAPALGSRYAVRGRMGRLARLVD